MATALTESGKTIEVNLSQPLAVDYTLVNTSYQVQGLDGFRVFVSAMNDPTSNREPFYVSISRQLKSLKIWVQDLEGLKRRVVESNVQQNPLELLFGESNETSPIREHDAAAQRGIEPDAAATGAEPSDAAPAQQLYQQHPDPSERRDGLIPEPVRGATGEPEALRDSGRNSGTDRNPQGAEGPTDELGADPRGYDLSGELRHRGDSELRDAVAQQRLDASAANLKSCMERVISSLSVLGNDELVHDSAIVESTREVVEALEPIVSSLEGQPVAVPPKRDLTSAMARVINGLTAMDSEDVFDESEIIAEIKSLVSRVEAHTIAQEQLTQTGEPYVRHQSRINQGDRDEHRKPETSGTQPEEAEAYFGKTSSLKSEDRQPHLEVQSSSQRQSFEQIGEHHVEQNSSRESTRPTARRDSGVENNGREYGQFRQDTGAERPSADIAASLGESNDIGRTEDYASDYARRHAGANQAVAQTDRGKERESAHRQGEPGHRRGTASDREAEFRDVATQPRTARSKPGIGESAAHVTPSTAADFGLSHELAGTTDQLQALADAIVRIRLQRELAGPLAQYRSTLRELREVLKQNAQLQADIQEKSVTYSETQAKVREVKATVAQKQATVADKLQQVLTQAKLEVLDTTLTEWRSLRQEPELHQIPELAVAPSDRAELTNLIANYPAQKVIDYAMAEYGQVRQHFELDAIGDAKHQAPASATKMPTPRTNSPPKPKQSTAAPGRAASPPKPKPRNQRNPTPRPEKRVPVVAFWQPDYVEARRPDLLEPEHWEEFKRSAIHPDLVELNVSSLEGQPVLERLLDEKLGSLSGDANQYATEEVKRIVKPYERVAEGGWWGTAGIDAKSLIDLQPGEKPQQSLWGVFKPDKPILEVKKPLIRYRYGEIDIAQKVQRQNTESLSVALLMAAGINANKFIEYRARKYENPAGTERHLYLPNVPDEIAQRIYAKHDIQPTEAEQQRGFWSVVASHSEIPIVVTEGFKKTLSSLSQGEVTIGLAGVNALYRARDDDKEKLPERQLNEEMAIFATSGRSFTFAFDSDSKTSTVFNVRAELVRGLELLEARGSDVKVAKWKPELGKGLDDLITNQGPTAYAVAVAKAEAAEREKRLYYRTQYNALAKEVRKTKLGISGEALDIEVYLLAITKGELKDGERFLSQSDHARSLKDPLQVTAYIEHIKASVPQYLQSQKVQEQERKDRARYEELSQSITAELGALKPGPLNIEVCIRLKLDNPNLERILAQSDWAKSRETPEEKYQYIQLVQSAALLTLQQRVAAQDRSEYESRVAQIPASPAQLSPEAVDIQVLLMAEQAGNPGDGDRLIAQSDHALSLNDPDRVQAYIKHIKAAAPQYLQQQKELETAQAQQVQNRADYEALTQQVKNPNVEQPAQVLDMQVYLMAEEECPGNGDRLIAQSDHARTLSNPQEVQAYVERIKAEAPLWLEQSVESARAAVHRETYEALSQEITQTLGDLPDEQRDTEVHLLATARGLESASILAQSNQALQLHSPDEVENYVERLQGLGLEQVQRQAEAQHNLSVRAMGSSSHLLSFLAQKDSTGWRRLTIAEYTLSGTEGYFSVDHSDRGNILKVVNDQLTANVTAQDVQKFEKAIENVRERHQKMNRGQVNRAKGFEIGD